MIIRTCLKDDVSSLSPLLEALWKTETWRNFNVMQKSYKLSYKRSIEKDPESCFVALIEDKIVGTARASVINEKVGAILNIMVLSDYRLKGIGSTLMKRCFSYLKAKGCKYATVEVYLNNTSAMKFYKRQGFKVPPFAFLLEIWSRFFNSKPTRAQKLSFRLSRPLET
ncbi:MAG: GNAT family N-acetyltransferase [Candidatus Bathyarchaeota archaeon]|jgi:ribosomal protein S18 acetylase RimI-like enzyme